MTMRIFIEFTYEVYTINKEEEKTMHEMNINYVRNNPYIQDLLPSQTDTKLSNINYG